jgi:hypothetical protein
VVALLRMRSRGAQLDEARQAERREASEGELLYCTAGSCEWNKEISIEAEM